ncbi:CPBP family intramembrane glutamic endopeptidase [Cryptosporangium aurantiacum]|uniref:CAAX protease self-immunity n=1 Tax=Cryptosporangium aurantiacum TaxID=134849 RepID=A0A1M7R233_9ACTN|nr:CPBP family intramembrane glutamic endopeptidase [Cryptosporangium aurantiacum]SHN38991.1 CAAX protease self-immunity [Cryptosporangium aurantiacum]
MAVLAAHNVVGHRLLSAPADAASNLASAAGLTAFAHRSGCSRGDLGIDRADVRSGLRTGLGAAALATGMVAAAVALPAFRRFFDDARVRDVRRAEAAYHLVVRIPLATALAEELLFRGALLALFRRRRSDTAAVVWTSLLFGAWHVLPTLDHYDGNAVSETIADRARGRRLAVAATGLSTTGAGVVFAVLRLRSRSVLAPVLTHAAINIASYLAARTVTRAHGLTDGGR